MSPVTHMNTSRHTCEWVIRDSFVACNCVLRSNVSMTCHAHSNESCHACEWVMSHLWMNHDHDRLSCSSRVCREEIEQRDNDVWVISHMTVASHLWMRRVTYGCVMPHITPVCCSAMHSALLAVQHRFFPSCAHQPGVLQCVAMCRSALRWCNLLQRVAVRCSVLECVGVRWSVLQCVAMRCSALQWACLQHYSRCARRLECELCTGHC